MKYEHICYLSDGTKLSQSEYAELQDAGILHKDGRTFALSPNARACDAVALGEMVKFVPVA